MGEWPPWVSPDTGEPLEPGPDAWVSPSGRRYPVVRGIPRFVDSDSYADNFGHQWNKFLKTQLDSHTGLPLSRDRLRRAMGPQLFDNLAGQDVLEAGCGAGRFTEILLEQRARVTSIDLSSAVEANVRNFPQGPQHRVAQADILRLPFAADSFGVVVCLGVLQHTPDPEASMRSLYERVRPGGWLVVDHYTHERRWGNVKPFYRQYLKRQPSERRMEIVERLVDRWLPRHRALRNFYPAWFLLCRFSPITTFYRLYPQLREELQREFALLDTHDSLTDWYKHVRTREQVERHLASLGGVDIHAEYAGNGVEARCRKPARG